MSVTSGSQRVRQRSGPLGSTSPKQEFEALRASVAATRWPDKETVADWEAVIGQGNLLHQ